MFEIKRDAQAEVVLNQLYQHSMLQSTYGVMMLAIVKGRPELLNLKQMLQHYIDHRHEVVLRHARYDLDKAEARAHALSGLRFALDHIDWVINTIRSSASPEEAKQRLMEGASQRSLSFRALAVKKGSFSRGAGPSYSEYAPAASHGFGARQNRRRV